MTEEAEKVYYEVRYCSDERKIVEAAELDAIYKSGRPVFEVNRLPKEKNG